MSPKPDQTPSRALLVKDNVVTTIRDGGGNVLMAVAWFFDPVTRVLRNNETDWASPTGTVWAAGSGALILDSALSHPARCVIRNADGNVVKQLQVPASGQARKAQPLSNDPEGPFVTAADFNGLSFDLMA